MDLKKCLEILELKNANSLIQVKQAYRDLVHVWHPDRFSSNSRIQERAEEKMREINIAYEKLNAYLSSDNGKNRLAMLNTKSIVQTPPRDQVAANVVFKTKDSANVAPKAKLKKHPPRGRARSIPSGVSGTSSSHKYILLGFVAILAAISILIINILLRLDESSLETKKPISSLAKKLASDSHKSKPAEKAKMDGRFNRKNKSVSRYNSHKRSSTNGKKYCEIYLKGGNIIIAETWWEQDNMIMYKTRYGTMGVEKSSVEKIVSN